MSETVVPSSDRAYYEQNISWFDFEPVVRHMNAAVSGDPEEHWTDWLARLHGPFERVLSLNCGVGWVERSLFERGLLKSVVGVDVAADHLATARRDAAELGMPAEYVELDTNVAPLPDGPFDMILNHAALHHVANIDHVIRGARKVIASDGVFVHFDYTGAHRNQYDERTWATVLELNASFPEHLRYDALCYPHLPTMLAVDPTEAIHSELILRTLDRYFDADMLVPVGGPIAYQLLFGNAALHEHRATPEGSAALARIVELDTASIGGDPARAAFTFALLRPRPDALDDPEQLEAWTAEERERERAAAANGGEYYPRTAFGMVYCELADEQMKVLHMTIDNARAAEARGGSARAVIARGRRVADRAVRARLDGASAGKAPVDRLPAGQAIGSRRRALRRPSSRSATGGHGASGWLPQRSTMPCIQVCTWTATKNGSRSSFRARRMLVTRSIRIWNADMPADVAPSSGTSIAPCRSSSDMPKSIRLENSTRYWPWWSIANRT